MKALSVFLCAVAFGHATQAVRADTYNLGALSGYYGDCPARNGPHAAYVRSVIRRAIGGDHAAMRAVIMHDGLFSTGDNEGYSEVPYLLLQTIGDARYSAFVAQQPLAVQTVALSLYPEQTPAFDRRFPKTAQLYHARFSR